MIRPILILMGFDQLMGDQRLDEIDPKLAAEMWSVFLVPFVQLTKNEVSSDVDQSQILIYVRPARDELRIDGPGADEEWYRNSWRGDAKEAMAFAEDAGHAAGLNMLGKGNSSIP